MCNSALSWFGRSVIAIVASLLWIGFDCRDLSAADQKPAAHSEANNAEAAAPASHAAPAKHDAKADNHAATHGDAQPSPIDWSTDLALWSLIVFVIFVTILRVFAWTPLSSALNAREHKIKSDIAEAEAARVKAETMLAEYQSKLAAAQEEVLKTLAEARRDAEHTKQEIMAATEKEVTAMKQRALQEIQQTTDQALQEIFSHMAGTVASATEKVLGRALTDADQERLIGDALAGFSRGQAS